MKMKKLSFDKFESMVSYFKKKLEENRHAALMIYHQIGQQVNIIRDTATYGDQTVEVLASKLGIGKSLLYRFGQFAIVYTESEVEGIKDKNHIGWGVVNKLISIKNKQDRTVFEEKLCEGIIKPSRLAYAVSKHQAANREKPKEDLSPEFRSNIPKTPWGFKEGFVVDANGDSFDVRDYEEYIVVCVNQATKLSLM